MNSFIRIASTVLAEAGIEVVAASSATVIGNYTVMHGNDAVCALIERINRARVLPRAMRVTAGALIQLEQPRPVSLATRAARSISAGARLPHVTPRNNQEGKDVGLVVVLSWLQSASAPGTNLALSTQHARECLQP